MRLGIGNTSKRAIEVTAAQNILHCLILINPIQSIKQLQARYANIRKPCIYFAPLISKERTIRLLEPTDVLYNFIYFYLSKLVNQYDMRSKTSRISIA